MTILLTILKVIGIILLVLLAVILALLLLVLFFPVTYGVRGELEEEIRIRGKVSWLFSLIALRFEVINKEAHVQMSILGIFKKNIFPAEEHPKPKKKRRKKDEQEEPSEETTASIQAAEIPVEQDLQQETSEQQKEQQKESEQQEQRQNRSRKKKDGKSLKKYLPWNIIRTWIRKIKAFFFSLKKNFSNIKKNLSDETNKKAAGKLFKELKSILRHVGPRRGRADLSYSTGDPATTGQLTGILSMMPLMYKKGIRVRPDFTAEHFYVRGTFRINGHIQLFRFLGTAIRLYRDKDVKALIRKFK